MEVLIVKIKNNTDDIQDIDVLNKITFGTEVETEVKEMNLLFDGFKIICNTGSKVDSCFYNKSINVNGVDIYIPEWFSISQLTNDYANIKMIVDCFQSIVFRLNPRKKIDLYIPLMKCKFKLYDSNKIKQKQHE